MRNKQLEYSNLQKHFPEVEAIEKEAPRTATGFNFLTDGYIYEFYKFRTGEGLKTLYRLQDTILGHGDLGLYFYNLNDLIKYMEVHKDTYKNIEVKKNKGPKQIQIVSNR